MSAHMYIESPAMRATHIKKILVALNPVLLIPSDARITYLFGRRHKFILKRRENWEELEQRVAGYIQPSIPMARNQTGSTIQIKNRWTFSGGNMQRAATWLPKDNRVAV